MLSYSHAVLVQPSQPGRGARLRRVLLGTLALVRLVLVMALMLLALTLLSLVGRRGLQGGRRSLAHRGRSHRRY